MARTPVLNDDAEYGTYGAPVGTWFDPDKAEIVGNADSETLLWTTKDNWILRRRDDDPPTHYQLSCKEAAEWCVRNEVEPPPGLEEELAKLER